MVVQVLEQLNQVHLNRLIKMVEKEKSTKVKKEVKEESKKMENKEEIKTENKEGKSKKDEPKVEIKKKDLVVARGSSLRISPKYACAICKVIRGKSPSDAVIRLQAVVDKNRVIPMAGLEVGHKKGKGLAGGKYPQNACKAIIGVIKQLTANAIVAEIENPIITIAKADRAPAPYRKGGRKGKRAHVYLEAKDKTKLVGTPKSVPSKEGKK